jgi:hypothetical protein
VACGRCGRLKLRETEASRALGQQRDKALPSLDIALAR